MGLSDKDRKKLLESITNKITDTMGIVADVNLLYEGKLQYIEIIVDKYPSLISYDYVFFKSGMIEAWGRGFDKIKDACAKYNGRLPEYNISASGIMVLCKACDKYLELLKGNENNSIIINERIMSEKLYSTEKIKDKSGIIFLVTKEHSC